MRAAGPIVGIAAFILLSGIVVWTGSGLTPGGTGEKTSDTLPVVADSAEAPPPVTTVAPAPVDEPRAPARPVAPGLIAAPEADTALLQRIEPRGPLSEPPGPIRRPPGPTLLHRPVAVAAGRVEVDGLTIVPEGIEPIEPEQTCSSAGGVEWPCGMMARTAFRSWLRGRSIACVLPQETGGAVLPVPCTIGKADMGAWLVQNGWARAIEGGRYEEDGRKAEREGLGVFRAGPPG